MKGEKEDDRWGHDVMEKDQGKERLAAGTRGDADGGRRGASSRESWGRLGPATCGAASASSGGS
jgi:hypothetical protein